MRSEKAYQPPVPFKPLSLTRADVCAAVLSRSSVSAEVVDGVRAVFQQIERDIGPLDAGIVSARALRADLLRHGKSRFGMPERLWRHVRKLISLAMHEIGLERVPRRDTPIALAWLMLLSEIRNDADNRLLRRFARWASARNLSPNAIQRSHFDLYWADLLTVRTPEAARALYVETTAAWNRAVAALPALWPQVPIVIECFDLGYSEPLSAYPQSITAEIEDLIACWSVPGQKSGRRRGISDDTADAMRSSLRRFLHGLRQMTAIKASDLTSLRVALTPSHIRHGLNWHLKQQQGKRTSALYNTACLLRRIARKWLKLSPAEISSVTVTVKSLNPKKRGPGASILELFTHCRRTPLLDQIDGIGLRVLERYATRAVLKKREALEVQAALALEVMLATAGKRGKIVAMTLTAQANETRGRIEGQFFAAAECKADPIPVRETVSLLYELYIDRARCVLAPTANSGDWLFPGRDGGHKNPCVLARQVSKLVENETRKRLTLTELRYAVGALYLIEYPERLEGARRLMGHTSRIATRRAFKTLGILRDFERYDQRIRADLHGAQTTEGQSHA
jgi:hypothetical protein